MGAPLPVTSALQMFCVACTWMAGSPQPGAVSSRLRGSLGDGGEDHVQIVENGVVSEAEDAIVAAFEKRCTVGVGFLLNEMDVAVYFDDQPGFDADKVDDVAFNRVLPKENEDD